MFFNNFVSLKIHWNSVHLYIYGYDLSSSTILKMVLIDNSYRALSCGCNILKNCELVHKSINGRVEIRNRLAKWWNFIFGLNRHKKYLLNWSKPYSKNNMSFSYTNFGCKIVFIIFFFFLLIFYQAFVPQF